MQTQTPLLELHNAYKAVRARIDAPRVIVLKPKPRPFLPTVGARFALSGVELGDVLEITPKRPCSTGRDANYHVRAYRLDQAGVKVDSDEPIYPRVAEIVAAVSAVSGVSAMDIKSHRRLGQIILPRQVAMYLCRILTPATFPEIAHRMGGRDHTTVLYAYRKIDAIKDREDVAALISAATALLRKAAP